MVRIILGSLVEFVGPSVDDGALIEVFHGGHDAILEFLLGCDADLTQDRTGELGEEALDQIEPGTVLGRESELEATRRPRREPGVGFLGDVGGMIARIRRIAVCAG